MKETKPTPSGTLDSPAAQTLNNDMLARPPAVTRTTTRRNREPSHVDDPREDLREDHDLWVRLLLAAYAVDGESADGLFGALHGIRCLGARLQPTRRGIRLYPGELRREEYALLREEYLVPHTLILHHLLALLTAEHDAGLLTAS